MTVQEDENSETGRNNTRSPRIGNRPEDERRPRQGGRPKPAEDDDTGGRDVRDSKPVPPPGSPAAPTPPPSSPDAPPPKPAPPRTPTPAPPSIILPTPRRAPRAPSSAAPWWRPRLTGLLHHRATLAVGAGTVAAALVAGYLWHRHDQAVEHQRKVEAQRQEVQKKHCGTLDPALVTYPHGECAGVTDGGDGSKVFGASLEPALTAIGAENAEATRAGHYVTIAFLAPMSSTGAAADLTQDQFTGEIEGAYTAVERANAGDSPLKIRLVLANMGSGEQHWKQTVGALKKVKNLVAVAGLGLSQKESVEAARALSKEDLPMVADLITADGFDSTGAIDSAHGAAKPIKGLTRVSLTNAAQLKALGKALGSAPRTAAVVRSEVTPVGSADYYTDSLHHDFVTLDGLKQHLDPGQDFAFDPRGGAESILGSIGQDLCTAGHPVDTVYYAAREKYLPDFLQALAQRSCHQQHITVVTGSDTSALDPTTLSGLNSQGDSPITVLYANLPSPAALRGHGNTDHDLYARFMTAFTADHHGQTFPAGDTTRGTWPVFAHDAVLTLTTAIRRATTPDHPLPTKYDVRNHLFALTNGAVPAATGRFGIDSTGNRTSTPLVVHRLGPAL
ncbi:hypothetical protein [Streptomyces mangrovisoli]|uniref:Leucine-binding protein domain-containing protein n=1 Tax=Streptomyces mangrovisoli TaxID=1428628 RepID=A0A1J4NS86_9ACTN|nr:hypothetical protein [Streptomyces mangrovisoli]OIJ65329.1 hypothetical protein WN71_023920 [Streptomyces mangrovisoli]